MKKSYIKTLCLEFIIINIIILNMFVFKVFEANNLSYFFLWLLIDIFLGLFIGIEKDKSLYKKDIIQIVFVYSFIYFIVIWSIGLLVGFTKNPYSLNILNIIKNTFPVIGIIVFQEFFRFNIIRKCDQSKFIIFTLSLLLIIINIALNINSYDLSNGTDVFEFFGLLVIPSILNNFVLTYMTYKSGYFPAILYRIIFEVLLVYIVPINPKLGIYFESVLKPIFPTIIYLKLSSLYEVTRVRIVYNYHLLRKLIDFLFVAFLSVILVLVSGAFKYNAMSVGSNSMYPKIKKNDAIIVEKITNYDKLNIGDILVYKHDKEVILHRIIKITKDNNTYIFKTKGDNNNSEDNWIVNDYEVIGIVKFKVPFVGYPSVWLSEVLGG